MMNNKDFNNHSSHQSGGVSNTHHHIFHLLQQVNSTTIPFWPVKNIKRFFNKYYSKLQVRPKLWLCNMIHCAVALVTLHVQ